jgi:hypothetical protein
MFKGPIFKGPWNRNRLALGLAPKGVPASLRLWPEDEDSGLLSGP